MKPFNDPQTFAAVGFDPLLSELLTLKKIVNDTRAKDRNRRADNGEKTIHFEKF